MPKISVAIATFNEEDNIKDCLESLKLLEAEVVVVDGSSTDKTRQIAKELGAKVIKTQNRVMFHTNKNLAIKACSGSWILVLDADERLGPELAQEMKKIASEKWDSSKPAGYWLKRKNFFLGRFLKKGGQYPDPVIRFFKKGRGIHPEVSVHEQIKIKGQIGWLENDLTHLASPTFARYLTRENRYSSLEAAKLAKDNLPLNLLTAFQFLLLKPLKTFFSLFIRHRGFVDGFPGFVFALFSGLHHALAYIKYSQMRKSPQKADISKNWR
jgi:glycosyltransferase involved in cell wall biosynthesis